MQNIDKVKVALALLLVAVGVAAYDKIPVQHAVWQVPAVLLGVLAALAVMWTSEPGRQFVDYARDSVKEAQKVVWPSKKETWQVTGIVFVFVGVLALFMWIVDSGLVWLFYDVVLGRHG